MRSVKAYVTLKTGQNKASPTESEIHPSHKPAVYALCISLLRRAVTVERSAPNGASFLWCRWLFRICSDRVLQCSPAIILLIDQYGKPIRGRKCFAEIISLHAAMILQKCQPLYLPGNGRMLVTASPKLALAGQHEKWPLSFYPMAHFSGKGTDHNQSSVDVFSPRSLRICRRSDSRNEAGGYICPDI